MKPSLKKILIIVAIVVAVIVVIGIIGGGDSEPTTTDSANTTGATNNTDSTTKPSNTGNGNILGNYTVEIKSYRLAKDYESKPVVIIKYSFTNNDNEPASFNLTFKDQVYQDGVGLNECYVADDSANYSADNQNKEIKKGASLEVEVAYVLNDTTSDLEVEISELFSYSDKTITKTFSLPN